MGWRGLKLEVGRRRRKKQAPRCARNDNLRVFRRVAEVWLWLRNSALRGVEAARRSGEPHSSRPSRDKFRGELQGRVGVIRAVRVRAGRGIRGWS
jgi:hypothetical protein